MAWDPELNSLFPHTVTLTEPGTLNSYGRKAAGATSHSVSAHVEYKTRLVRKIDGTETMSSVSVYLSGADGVLNVTPEWAITLPDTTSRPIASIDRYADEDGDMVEVLHLQ
jgi:hypothetical protein